MRTAIESAFSLRAAALLLVAATIGTSGLAVAAGELPVVNCAERNHALNPHAHHWDVARDFSISCNPIGPWSYGATDTLGGNFTAFTQTGTITFQVIHGAVGQWVGTYLQGGQYFPIISKFYGDPGTTVSVVGGDGQQDDQEEILVQRLANKIVMHPTLPGLGYGVIRWTAPRSGTYVISVAFFSAEDDGGTISATTDVHVQKNHVSLFDGHVNQIGVVEKYSTGRQGIALHAGDLIDIAIGPDGDLSSDSTSVDAEIDELGDHDRDHGED
jgi:hypothetical protein